MAGVGDKKTGGRKKGTLNKRTTEVIARLSELDCDPVAGLAELCTGEAPCRTCNTKGKVSADQYYLITRLPMSDQVKAMTPAARSKATYQCPKCRGTKIRALDDGITLKARSELMNYIAPKRKSVDLNHSADKTFEELLEELK